jgi:hypothetical protein
MILPANTPRLASARGLLALVLVILILIAVFVPFPAALHNQYVCALLDFCHFFWAGGACWFLCSRLRWSGWSAFGTVVAAAALCEVLQGFTGRCPSAVDFVRGLFGTLAVLACLSAIRPSRPRAEWIGAWAIAVAISAWPVSEFLLAAARFCVRVSLVVG